MGTDFIKRGAEVKLQAPTSNLQRNTKAQAPNVNEKPNIVQRSNGGERGAAQRTESLTK